VVLGALVLAAAVCCSSNDEVDALGANRTDMLKSGGRQIINQFLSELDGVAASNVIWFVNLPGSWNE
jgi:ATP-dependent 26S proteasome regulatory subunit